jgi:hypothetical protein
MRLAAALALLTALALAAPAIAGENPQYRPNPRDMASARASLLRASDLGTGWTGGATKAARPQGPDCATFTAKQSDLVVTGTADAEFRSTIGGLQVESEVQVLKTPAMVARDFARTVRPELVRCLAREIERSAGAGARFVSLRRLPFPRLGSVSAAYRLIVAVPAQGQTVRLAIDVVAVGIRRTEISLVTIVPTQAQDALLRSDRRLAAVLAARARP